MKPEQLILTDTDNKDLQLISLLGESGLTPTDVVNAIVRIHNSVVTPDGVLMTNDGNFIVTNDGDFIVVDQPG